jgi:small subunit ribosomal protein S20
MAAGLSPPFFFSERMRMANTSSAKKAARKIARRTEINKARRSRVRNFVRKVEEAIASGNRDTAIAALKEAEPEIMRAAQKGVVHKHAASRKVSRLTHRIVQLGK